MYVESCREFRRRPMSCHLLHHRRHPPAVLKARSEVSSKRNPESATAGRRRADMEILDSDNSVEGYRSNQELAASPWMTVIDRNGHRPRSRFSSPVSVATIDCKQRLRKAMPSCTLGRALQPFLASASELHPV